MTDSYSTDPAADGGSVTFNADSLTIDGLGSVSGVPHNAGIYAETDGAADAGMLLVDVTGAVSITAGASISSSTRGTGNAGSLTVDAGSLTVNGPNQNTGLYANGGYTGGPSNLGSAGEIDVTVAGDLDLLGHGRIAARSFGQGNGGAIQITASNLTVENGSLIAAGAEFADTTSSSRAGSITINVKNALTIASAGQIETNTLTAGDAGQIVDNGGFALD